MTFNTPINTNEIETDFAPIPSKWYKAQIVKNTDRATTTGGVMTSYEYVILGPDHANRKVFSNHNVKNSSVKAQEIGCREVGTIAKACGLVNLRDTQDVVGKTLEIFVTIEKDNNGNDRNRVSKWQVLTGSIQSQPQGVVGFTAPQPVTAAAPQPTEAPKPVQAPWFT